MQQHTTPPAGADDDASEDAAFQAWLRERFQLSDNPDLVHGISNHIEPVLGELWELMGASEVAHTQAAATALAPPEAAAAAAASAWPSGGAPAYQLHAAGDAPVPAALSPTTAMQGLEELLLLQRAPQVGWTGDLSWMQLLQQQQQQEAAPQHALMAPQLQPHDSNTAPAAAAAGQVQGAAASSARRSGGGGSAGGSGRARGGKAGGSDGARKPRVTTDAQRRAHKRFRVRRKEQVCGAAMASGVCAAWSRWH